MSHCRDEISRELLPAIDSPAVVLFNNAGAKHLKHYWNRLKVKADDLFDQVGSDSSHPDPYSAAA